MGTDGVALRQTAATVTKHLTLGVFGLGCEDALAHLMNFIWPNIFEQSPHVINAVMVCVFVRVCARACMRLQASVAWLTRGADMRYASVLLLLLLLLLLLTCGRGACGRMRWRRCASRWGRPACSSTPSRVSSTQRARSGRSTGRSTTTSTSAPRCPSPRDAIPAPCAPNPCLARKSAALLCEARGCAGAGVAFADADDERQHK